MFRSDAPFSGELASRTLPPITSALSSTLPPWTARRSKSSTQSDESFSAYLNNPSSSSPALDRALDGSISRRYSIQRSGGERRGPPNLDAISYAQERASPYGRSRVSLAGTPISLRDMSSKLDWDHHMYRQSPVWRTEALPPLAPPRQHADATSYTPFPLTSIRSNQRSDSIEDAASEEDDDADEDDDEDDDNAQDSGEADFDNTQDSQDMSADGKKKKRRRTNKKEAIQLAAVFEETAFPDVSTREALAVRLGMSLRSVSIWFQNRRQAMKKRASRFGGVDGVRGAAVTPFARRSHDLSEGEADVEAASNVAQGRLKRWLSLDEVAARDVADEDSVLLDRAPSLIKIDNHDKIAAAQGSETNKSRAPILDLLQKRLGNRLSRVSSMPVIAAALNNTRAEQPGNAGEAAHEQHVARDPGAKDLRDVLKDLVAQSRAAKHRGLTRSASLMTLPTRSNPMLPPASVTSGYERSQSVEQVGFCRDAASKEHVIDDGVHDAVAPPQPLDVVSQAPIGHDFALAAEEEQKSRREREIWKRMQSSSSGMSSDNTPESDKENVNTARKQMMLDEDGFEDEEKTLRRIAQRRASRQEAKKEHKLSQEGTKYVQEADARLALKAQGGVTSAKEKTAPRLPLQALPVSRTFKRARSDVAVLGRRSGLSRVTSLDIEAGRDRSKAAERPSPLAMSAMVGSAHLAKKRSRHMRRATVDENSVSASKGGMKRSSSSSKPVRHSIAAASAQRSYDVDMRKSGEMGGRRRDFVSTKSMPSVQALYAAASDSRRPSPASQDSNGSSIGVSEEWTEGWYGEQRAQSAAVRADEVSSDWWRSLKRKSPAPLEQREGGKRARRVASGGHDDSGFFGSDDGDVDGENVAPWAGGKRAGAPAKAKGHADVMSQRSPLKSIQGDLSAASSSPLKRGDERDRLAAETLLAFGSFA